MPPTAPAATAAVERVELRRALQLKGSPLVVRCEQGAAGRSFVSDRAVEAGAVVLSVKPELVAPRWPCEIEVLSDEERAIVGCDDGSGLNSSSGEAAFAAEVSALWLLGARAALAVVADVGTFAAALALEDHTSARAAPEAALLDLAGRRLSAAVASGADVPVPPATCTLLLGVLLTNTIGIRDASSALGGGGGGGGGAGGGGGGPSFDSEASSYALCLTASLFNHSCVPNVSTDFMLSEGGKLTFRARAPIRAGDRCEIAYIDTSEPTYQRQAHLQRTKHFTCGCTLCSDPTEDGRCSSFLLCHRCPNGWQTRARPEAGDWRCAACGHVTPHPDLVQWDAQMRSALAAAIARATGAASGAAAAQPASDATPEGHVTPEALPTSEGHFRSIIQELNRRVHPNHALLLQARLALVAFGFRKGAEGGGGEGGGGEGGGGEGGGGEGSLSALERKTAAAEGALHVAKRVLGDDDLQVADLHFQLGVCRHSLAYQAKLGKVGKTGGKLGTFGKAVAMEEADEAAAERSREATCQLRLAAASLISARKAFADALGPEAGPAASARELGNLCLAQIRTAEAREKEARERAERFDRLRAS